MKNKAQLASKDGLKVIFERWTGTSDERREVIRRIRQCGVNRVIALYFVTPLEQVEDWFWKKPGIAKSTERSTVEDEEDIVFYSSDAPRHDHALFHELAERIDSNGFDQVIRVNPLEPLVELP